MSSKIDENQSHVFEFSGDASSEAILQVLKDKFPNAQVKLQDKKNSDNKQLTIDVSDDSIELETTKKMLEDSERKCQKALGSIQSFHKQQKALFEEFALLRQRYDEQKVAFLDVLWTHCAIHHPDLRQIPDMESEDFIESEDRIGKYEILDLLGEGQFATVKSCTMSGFNDYEFALKIICKDQISTFVSIRRVSNEIGALKKLQSPYIVRITDVFHTNQFLYIVTEKGGSDLFAFFDEHPDGVSEEWGREILTYILKAVFFCHQQGICHRDLKPENILLDFDIETGRCNDLKLCDFGLSTNYGVNSSNVLLKDFCGSPGFFAPEMITVGSYYGDKVDIWSVGCILLELILGHQTFCDAWMAAYDYEILQQKDRFQEEIATTVSGLPEYLNFSDNLNDFVIKILALVPEKRINAIETCIHPWLNGSLDKLGQNLASQMPKLRTGRMDDIPQVTQDGTALSNRERRMIEEYNQKRNLSNNGNAEGQVQLPPIMPATPSLRQARKILKKGDALATQNEVSFERTNSHNEGIASPTTGDSMETSPRAMMRSKVFSVDENDEA